MGSGPASGDVGVGVSILSYGGGVQFGLITDMKVCPHPQQIINRFEPLHQRRHRQGQPVRPTDDGPDGSQCPVVQGWATDSTNVFEVGRTSGFKPMPRKPSTANSANVAVEPSEAGAVPAARSV